MRLGLLAGGAAIALGLALPALGQDAPESLLPPGFADPAPTPAPAAPQPAPGPAPGPTPSPRPATPGSAQPANPGLTVPDSSIPDIRLQLPSGGAGALAEGGVITDPDALAGDDLVPSYSLSPSERRSLANIGVIGPEQGGLPANAFGGQGGQYLSILLRETHGPMASRWAAILLRRTLLSKVDSPANVHPADWAAARSWLLLRMGEADAARAMTSAVDVGNYTPRLYEAAMQAHLANGDPAGLCPLVQGGVQASKEPAWDMFRPICASLSGEQSRATALLREMRRKGAAKGIDYLLAEKLIGAGFGGRRAVTIDWSEYDGINNWRFGLGLATGVEPPERLLNKAGRHIEGWRAQAPMLSFTKRIAAADRAAAMGVLSNQAMVDLYSAAFSDENSDEATALRTEDLRSAYRLGAPADRIAAMVRLWDASDNAMARYSALVLTARAAAQIPPGSTDEADRLISAMLAAGLDNSALRWRSEIDSGSLGWAQLAVADPRPAAPLDYDALDDVYDNDNSPNVRRSGFFLAGVAGLGRASGEDIDSFAESLDIDLKRQTKWSRAIANAARLQQPGTVALLAATGLQASDWAYVSPFQLYHAVRALRLVGLEAEARMIAAEALARAG
jgi:hypothetical protein